MLVIGKSLSRRCGAQRTPRKVAVQSIDHGAEDRSSCRAQRAVDRHLTHQIINKGLAVLKDPKRRRLVYVMHCGVEGAEEKLRQLIPAADAQAVLFVSSGDHDLHPQQLDSLQRMCAAELKVCTMAVSAPHAEEGQQQQLRFQELLDGKHAPDIFGSRRKRRQDISYFAWLQEEKWKLQEPWMGSFQAVLEMYEDLPPELHLSATFSVIENQTVWTDEVERALTAKGEESTGPAPPPTDKHIVRTEEVEEALTADSGESTGPTPPPSPAPGGTSSGGVMDVQLGSQPDDFTLRVALRKQPPPSHRPSPLQAFIEEDDWANNVILLEKVWSLRSPDLGHMDPSTQELSEEDPVSSSSLQPGSSASSTSQPGSSTSQPGSSASSTSSTQHGSSTNSSTNSQPQELSSSTSSHQHNTDQLRPAQHSTPANTSTADTNTNTTTSSTQQHDPELNPTTTTDTTTTDATTNSPTHHDTTDTTTTTTTPTPKHARELSSTTTDNINISSSSSSSSSSSPAASPQQQQLPAGAPSGLAPTGKEEELARLLFGRVGRDEVDELRVLMKQAEELSKEMTKDGSKPRSVRAIKQLIGPLLRAAAMKGRKVRRRQSVRRLLELPAQVLEMCSPVEAVPDAEAIQSSAAVDAAASLCMDQLRMRSTQVFDTGRDVVVVVSEEGVVQSVVQRWHQLESRLMMPLEPQE